MELKTDNPTESKILESARRLFWKHGIKRVSVEEICKEADLSKMTFYRYFKNKDDVAIRVILLVNENSRQGYRDLMAEEGPFKEKVLKMIQIKDENLHDMSHELIEDIMSNERSELKEILDSHQHEMLAEVMRDFGEAQKRGEIRKDLNLQFVLYQLNDMRNKLLDENLRALYKSEHDLIMELTRFFFYGILP